MAQSQNKKKKQVPTAITVTNCLCIVSALVSAVASLLSAALMISPSPLLASFVDISRYISCYARSLNHGECLYLVIQLFFNCLIETMDC